jgi:hypothetical protein
MTFQLIADQANKKLILKSSAGNEPIISKVLAVRARNDLSGLITQFTQSELDGFSAVEGLVELALTKTA